MKKEIFVCFLIVIIFNSILLLPADTFAQAKPKTKISSGTNWEVKPSFMLDTLCFLGVLTGDPFYTRFYKDEYAIFEPKLTPAARQALANLKRKIKDEQKDIISASLTLRFSITDAQNLDDLLKIVKDSNRMKGEFQKTTYYDEESWQTHESVREDLRVIFSFLKDIKFEEYWKQNYLPNVERKIDEIKPDLPKYNAVGEVEKLLGHHLESNKITAYILHFPKPHGIRVTGYRFIMSDSDPFKVTVFTAVHELMHPPFDLKRDTELKAALDMLQADEFLMDKVKNHNTSLGYNTFEGLVEEDCVQSLDQIINEKFGAEIAEAHIIWKKWDEGIHVLAVALYNLMKTEKFDGSHEGFRDFLLRMIKSGRLSAGKIKPIYDEFYANLESK